MSGTGIGAGEIANSKQIKRQMTYQVNKEILSVTFAKTVLLNIKI